MYTNMKRSGKNKNNFIDRRGITYGSLTAIEKQGHNKNGSILWLCRCECGEEIVVSSTKLGSRQKNHCGCLDGKNRERIFKTLNNIHPLITDYLTHYKYKFPVELVV